MHFVRTGLVIVLACAVASSCRPRREGNYLGDGGPDGGDDIPCSLLIDSDGDTIADQHEGGPEADFDLDGTPNFLDADSDEDGLPDSVEAGDTDLCTVPRDSDGDDWADFLDRDADNDGLSDRDEVESNGTDPTNPDSDGDGYTDLAEMAAGTDPNDPRVGIPEEDFFVVLPYGGPEARDNLVFDTSIEVADVFFLVDTTGSMSGTIDNVATSLRDVIVPGIRDTIDNAWIGVGRFEDFPVSGYGSFGTHAGTTVPGLPPDDVPFFLQTVVRDPVTDFDAIQQAVEYLRDIGIGGDGSESHVEGLYQTATGAGLSPWIPAQRCETAPDFPGVPTGYPCFRPGALPIVVLISDAEMHNGPAGYDSYTGVAGAATVDDAVAALNAIGARVIGVASNAWGANAVDHMRYVATNTGTVDATGQPLVYETGGEVSYEVVDAIDNLAGSTPQDVSTGREDLPDWPQYLSAGEPEVDATLFIQAITPVRTIPPENLLGAMTDTTFEQVIPGTAVEFEVHFFNDFVPPRETSRIYEAIIIVLGNGVARLDERRVYIIVPPEGQEVLI